MTVDLPEPDGPIRAVIWLGSTDREMSSIARRLPYQAERLEISKLDPIARRSSVRPRTVLPV